jgi:myo-inositol 2-dehydrogenase/D-chiro-inositol 1-dehydrogenase
MKKVELGLIGTGRIGKMHAENILFSVGSAELKSVADIYIEHSMEWANSLGLKNAYKDYKEIINDPEIDAVVICSTTDTHAQIIEEAALAGKHIFCEKPIDLDVSKVRKALEVVEKAGVKLQIGFNRRFDHNFRRVRELVQNGTVGDLHIVKITSRDPAPPSIEYIKGSGGLFLDMTIHDFDMARFLSGSEVEEVYAKAAVLVDPAIGEAGDIDTAVITLKFKNGAIGIIDNSRQAVYGYDQRVEVFGSKGCAIAGNDHPNTVEVNTVEKVSKDKPMYFFIERYKDAYIEEIKAFIDCIVNDKEPPVTGNDALEPILIGLAAEKSYKENRPVKVK